MNLMFSIGIVLLLGYLGGVVLNFLKLPKIIGMIFVGVLIGPYCLGLLDESILSLSSDLRKLALVIILTRSGLSLDINALRKNGRVALLMCFVPATIEIIGCVILAPLLIGVDVLEALLLGCVLAAVSPAIIVPRMIKLKEDNKDNVNDTVEIILAGSSADDIFVITLFYVVLGFLTSSSVDISTIIQLPISIIVGIGLGIAVGFLLTLYCRKFNPPKISVVIVTFSLSLLMVGLETLLADVFSIQSLLGVISMAIVVSLYNKEHTEELKKAYGGLWSFFEIILFVLVGAIVNISSVIEYAFLAVILIIGLLIFRSVGVLICFLGTKFNKKERIFSVISYIPKATVQASIGAIALDYGLNSGNVILSISVVSIIITAPLGAILIDKCSKKLLFNE